MAPCHGTQGASKVGPSSAGRSCDEYIEISLDVFTGPQFLDESTIQPSSVGVVNCKR